MARETVYVAVSGTETRPASAVEGVYHTYGEAELAAGFTGRVVEKAVE